MSPGTVGKGIPGLSGDSDQIFTDQSQMLVALTRMEAKMDVGFAQVVADNKRHSQELIDHEGRLRSLEGAPAVPPDHETRIRSIEARRTVSPRGMWTSITAGGGLIVALFTIFEKILGA